MNLSQKIKQLRNEYEAQKAAYEQSATKLTVATKNLTFSTSKNLLRYANGGINYEYEDQERVQVTPITNSAATLAKLEISGNYATPPIVRRAPFSGGARWIVSSAPRFGSGGWEPTTYNFTVQTLVNGSLSAEMVEDGR